MCIRCDSGGKSCQMLDASSDVPTEYCPVYVAPEQRRFVIPMSYFNLLVFRLLEKAEELLGRSSRQKK
ncbi:hypothetical protein B296_00040594 [Ensete ventricosum]|uniref:Uncharacterized protein n=1 Tax=Ensete ventricosum TaxID=4639 RepID=A0A426YME9_ENSVE|nr:hypothetical protein B296_00040594 [Ensete ventricosum]